MVKLRADLATAQAELGKSNAERAQLMQRLEEATAENERLRIRLASADGRKAATRTHIAGQPPQNALFAYTIFSNAKRDQVKKENPGFGFGDVAKKISEMWKNISASDKAKFEKAAQEDKKRYEREMADYIARGDARAAGSASEGEVEEEKEEDDDEEEEE